jgi:hypothetical protein
MSELANFQTHLYYFPENEEGFQKDLSALRESGHKVKVRRFSTTTPVIVSGKLKEVAVHELRITGEVDPEKFSGLLHNDDDDASWVDTD